MESLTYLYLNLVHDLPLENSQLIDNKQVFSFTPDPWLKGSKVTFISCFIFVSLLLPHLLVRANPVTIKEGDRGENVTLLQQQLSELGYFQGDISGYFGQTTTQAVKAFQESEKLTPDGIISQETQTILNQKTNNNFVAPPTLKLGDSGENVVQVQEKLQELGYFKDLANGHYNPSTKESIIAFQKSQELPPDGETGTTTLIRLGLKTFQFPTRNYPYFEINQGRNKPATETFTNSYNANTYIYLGDKGEQVKILQQGLQKIGYYQGQITGVFDQATANAVKKFQQENNITADGIVGAVTKAQIMQRSGVMKLTPTNLPAPNNIVKKGDSGDSVRWVQEKLKIAGFLKGNITGFFGELTVSAVKNFQKSRGIKADGIVGSTTRNALARYSSQNNNQPANNSSNSNSTVPTTTLKKGNSGSSVRWVQEKLKKAGFFKGEITGFFGVLTESAVKDFQRSRKLKPDGVIGTKTRNALNQTSNNSKNTKNINPSQGILRKGNSGLQVRWLQEKLTQLGFYKNQINGVFGPLTETAVKKFQAQKGLTADGIVGKNTQIAISDAIGKL